MYVHADRGASRATKTSVRATNMKHVDTREHTDEPRQRTHRERGGERAESAGLRSLSLSLSPSLSPSFFVPSMPRPFFSVPPSVLHAGCLGGSMYLFFYITGSRVREKKTRTSLYPYVCNADASVYSRILCRHAPSLFSIHSAFLSFLSIYLSIVLSPHMHAHRYCAPGTAERRTKRVVLHREHAQRERERERGSRERSLWLAVSLAERADRSREKRRRWRWRGIDVGIRGRSGGGNAASISERRKLREFCPKGHFFLATRKGGTRRRMRRRRRRRRVRRETKTGAARGKEIGRCKWGIG